MSKTGIILLLAAVFITVFAQVVLSSPFEKNFDKRPTTTRSPTTTRPPKPTTTRPPKPTTTLPPKPTTTRPPKPTTTVPPKPTTTLPPKPTTTHRPTTTTEPTTVRPPPDVIQTEGCGGVLEGNTGLLAYKLGEQLSEQDEICVWTIRSPASGQVYIELEEDGFSQTDANSYIAVFSVGEDAILQKSHKIFAGDRSIYTINGQVGYIIFRSSNENDRGFQLYFRGDSSTTGDDNSEWTGRNNTHVHFHLTRAQGYQEQFSYPPPDPENNGIRGRYRPNEFGSWVINPEGTKVINRLTLYYIDFEDFSFSDYINIHQVDGDSPKLLDRKYNTNTYFSSSFKYDTVREPFIITFHSDEKGERTGFILYYSNDRY